MFKVLHLILKKSIVSIWKVKSFLPDILELLKIDYFNPSKGQLPLKRSFLGEQENGAELVSIKIWSRYGGMK